MTARAIEYQPTLYLMGTRIRDTFCVAAQVLVLVMIVYWYVRRKRHPA